jgi:hypothetical protein
MNQIIELIPVLELPTLKDEDSQNHPTGSSLSNTQEWDNYQEKEIRKNYNNIGSPVSPGVYQYRLFDIDTEDLIKAIKLHISDLMIDDSCSLFGGYLLTLNNDIVLYPQCCGLLEEINDWIKLLDYNFEPFYLMECHPSPRFSRIKNDVLIDCSEDDNEPFSPRTQQKIFLDYNTLKKSLERLINDLEIFSKELDKLSGLFDSENISNILIWGRK